MLTASDYSSQYFSSVHLNLTTTKYMYRQNEDNYRQKYLISLFDQIQFRLCCGHVEFCVMNQVHRP